MMSNRPKDPKTARNKNVLVVGGSGSGKTRFFIKPNLMQLHSSYVVTDPKGSIAVECGKLMLRNGYKVKIFNSINFKKSHHYNPFAYIHSEKDILKLVTTLIANTKGDGKCRGRLLAEGRDAALHGAHRLYPLRSPRWRNRTSPPSSSSSTPWRCARTMRTFENPRGSDV